MEERYVLVTGAYGGLGRAVVEALLEKGYAVFASDISIDETLQGQIKYSFLLNVILSFGFSAAVLSPFTNAVKSVSNSFAIRSRVSTSGVAILHSQLETA